MVRTDHVGDLVLSTPFLKSLRSGLPQAEIVALVTDYLSPVLQGNPSVDRVVTDFALIEQPDLAVSLAPRSRAYRLVYASRAPYRVGYVYKSRPLVSLMSRLWLTHRLVVDLRSKLGRGEPIPHEVEQLGCLARAMGLEYADLGLEFPLSDSDRQKAAALVPSSVITFHLGRGWLTSSWTVADVVEVVKCLKRIASVVITCGPAEQEILSELGDVDGITVLSNLSLKLWGAIMAACKLVVSNDTGAVHVASAVGTPVVVVYDPDTFALCSQQWSPWQVPHKCLRKDAPDRLLPHLLSAVEELLRNSRN